jgi:hypothetical protein
MGRWAYTDEDEGRLPAGMVRIGYDADDQTYTYRDSDGSIWQGDSGCHYGTLRCIRPPPRQRPKSLIPQVEDHEKLVKVSGGIPNTRPNNRASSPTSLESVSQVSWPFTDPRKRAASPTPSESVSQVGKSPTRAEKRKQMLPLDAKGTRKSSNEQCDDTVPNKLTSKWLEEQHDHSPPSSNRSRRRRSNQRSNTDVERAVKPAKYSLNPTAASVPRVRRDRRSHSVSEPVAHPPPYLDRHRRFSDFGELQEPHSSRREPSTRESSKRRGTSPPPGKPRRPKPKSRSRIIAEEKERRMEERARKAQKEREQGGLLNSIRRALSVRTKPQERSREYRHR